MTTFSNVGAPSARTISWKLINWDTVNTHVRRLQLRIAKALQWLLTHSFYAKLLAIKRVTQNKGKNTPGVDRIIWKTDKQKIQAAYALKRRGYCSLPLRRIYIPKKNGKLRPLGIPAMIDRSQQALHLLGLEPIAEILGDKNSYGFRPKRSIHDAIAQCFIVLSRKTSAQYFERNLEDHVFQLQDDLITLQYQHDAYEHFYVSDPKQRRISKASVKDRLVHQIVYEVLTTVFDRKFIFHSLSSRVGKGTHIGVTMLHRMIRKVSANGKQPCYALKMDIKRFFDTVHHQILKTLLRKNIADEKVLKIIDTIIDSFKVNSGPYGSVGIPLGNATSQLFANVYLHELDDFIKQELRERYYLRYCDDFIILSNDKNHLESLIFPIREFLVKKLQLDLHSRN